MDTPELFPDEKTSAQVQLIYSASAGMIPAQDLGEAILGIHQSLKEAAKIAALSYDDIFIYPIEQGSIKTVFAYVKKNPLAIVVGIDLVANLLNNSTDLIKKFGADRVRTPDAEVLQEIKSRGVLDLCQSRKFREGFQKVAAPLSEVNQTAHIIIGSENIEISCENKYQFYENPEQEKILPDLKNGDTVTLKGEMTRINKTNNDLGFKYQDRTLSVSPFDNEESIVAFREYLALSVVELTGLVIRDSVYEVPKIKVTEVKPVGTQHSLLE